MERWSYFHSPDSGNVRPLFLGQCGWIGRPPSFDSKDGKPITCRVRTGETRDFSPSQQGNKEVDGFFFPLCVPFLISSPFLSPIFTFRYFLKIFKNLDYGHPLKREYLHLCLSKWQPSFKAISWKFDIYKLKLCHTSYRRMYIAWFNNTILTIMYRLTYESKTLISTILWYDSGKLENSYTYASLGSWKLKNTTTRIWIILWRTWRTHEHIRRIKDVYVGLVYNLKTTNIVRTFKICIWASFLVALGFPNKNIIEKTCMQGDLCWHWRTIVHLENALAMIQFPVFEACHTFLFSNL